MRSSRYMNEGALTGESAVPLGPVGLGTSAADPHNLMSLMNPRALYDATGARRLRSHAHVPFQPVGPSLLPDFYMPFETTLSPHLEAARRNLSEWALAVGITAEGLWDDRA